MRKLLFLLVSVCMAASAAAQDLTVASYNVRYSNDGDVLKGNGWKGRCPWICSFVEFQGLDVFGAQEVLESQLKDMLALLPDYDYIGVGRDDGKTAGEYAPIFYRTDRFRLLDDGHFWLSKITDRPNTGWDAALPRICTWGRFFDRKTRMRFWFFNLHMDHIGVKARAKGAKLVVDKIREMCGRDEYVILTGDFNVDQHNEVYTIFTESGVLRDSYEITEKRYAPNGTFNAFDPQMKTDSRIDHIFVSPSCRVRNYGILTETYRAEVTDSDTEIKSGDFPQEVSLRSYQARIPSDHFPIVVKLEFD